MKRGCIGCKRRGIQCRGIRLGNNEIWLLGAKCKSDTLESADGLWEAIWAGLIHGLIKVKGKKRLVQDGRVMKFWSGGNIPTEILLKFCVA